MAGSSAAEKEQSGRFSWSGRQRAEFNRCRHGSRSAGPGSRGQQAADGGWSDAAPIVCGRAVRFGSRSGWSESEIDEVVTLLRGDPIHAESGLSRREVYARGDG